MDRRQLPGKQAREKVAAAENPARNVPLLLAGFLAFSIALALVSVQGLPLVFGS